MKLIRNIKLCLGEKIIIADDRYSHFGSLRHPSGTCNLCDFHSYRDKLMKLYKIDYNAGLANRYFYHGYPTVVLNLKDQNTSTDEDDTIKFYYLYKIWAGSDLSYWLSTVIRSRNDVIVKDKRIYKCPRCNRRLDWRN